MDKAKILTMLVITPFLLFVPAAWGHECESEPGVGITVCADYCTATFYEGSKNCKILCWYAGEQTDGYYCSNSTTEECAAEAQGVPQCPEPPPDGDPLHPIDCGPSTP